MKSAVLKKKMHQAIDLIDDASFLEAINVLLTEKSQQYRFELSDTEKKELDKAKKLYKANKLQTFSVAEVRKSAYRKLKK
jgi:hypothetical protein